MIQKILRTIGISEQSTLLYEQKIVNQSSDFPVRRTGLYRHKKTLPKLTLTLNLISEPCVQQNSMTSFYQAQVKFQNTNDAITCLKILWYKNI